MLGLGLHLRGLLGEDPQACLLQRLLVCGIVMGFFFFFFASLGLESRVVFKLIFQLTLQHKPWCFLHFFFLSFFFPEVSCK